MHSKTFVKTAALVAVLGAALTIGPEAPRPRRLVLWAWERPEDLRFLSGESEVAALTGFVRIRGARLSARGRRDPLLADPARVTTAVVHVEIDPTEEVRWSTELEAQLAAAVLALGRQPWARRVQVDFEVRQSERERLLALLHRVRAGLPPDTALSMTAIASWCDTEDWLARAPVDEIVPMMFRMGAEGGRIAAKLERGGDLRRPECRRAIGLSSSEPLGRIPLGRRVYLFNPRSWTAADLARIGGSMGR